MDSQKGFKYKGLIIVLSILGLASAGAIYLWNQTKKLADFCFDFSGYKITNVTLLNMAVDVYLSIKNKSNLDVIIKGYDLDVYVNGNFISKVTNTNEQQLPANTKQNFTVSVNFNPTTLLKGSLTKDNILNALIDRSKVVFEFKGVLSASFAGVNVSSFPIAIKSSLADMIPDPNKPSTKCD